MMRSRKRALLGGTFDPVHNGHIALASLALDSLACDEVVFIPAGNPPHKQNRTVVSAALRLDMVRAALAPYNQFSVWDGELSRIGPSYTIDTVTQLYHEFGEESRLTFIIGSDNLSEIVTWHRFQELLAVLDFAVACRPGAPLEVPAVLSKGTFIEIPSPLWGVSSSLLRDFLGQGFNCEGLIPPPVAAYIRENRLYIPPRE